VIRYPRTLNKYNKQEKRREKKNGREKEKSRKKKGERERESESFRYFKSTLTWRPVPKMRRKEICGIWSSSSIVSIRS
jgi:hypothetical protein